MKLKSNNPFVIDVWKKVYIDRENCNILITGHVQKGKTTVGISLAREFNSNFSSKYMLYHPKNVIKFINENDLKRGDVLLIEEMGTEAGGVSRRKWYDFNNFLFNDVLQTYGFEGLIVMIDAPYIDFIDSNTLKLMNYRARVIGKDLKTEENLCKILKFEWDDENQKYYRESVRDFTGKKINNFWIKRTQDSELLRDCRKKEIEFKKWVQQQANERINKDFNTGDDFDKLMKQANKNKNIWRIRGKRKFVHIGAVMNEMNVGSVLAGRIKTKLENENK